MASQSSIDVTPTKCPKGPATPGEDDPIEVTPKKMRVMEIPLPGDEGIAARISSLKEEQSALQKQRKDIAKNLRNAERRRARLKTKARQLTDSDLVQVLMMRRQTRESRQVETTDKPTVTDVDPAGTDPAQCPSPGSSGAVTT